MSRRSRAKAGFLGCPRRPGRPRNFTKVFAVMIAAADLAEEAFRDMSAREAERFFDVELDGGWKMAYLLNRWPDVLRPLRALHRRALRTTNRALGTAGSANPSGALAARPARVESPAAL